MRANGPRRGSAAWIVALVVVAAAAPVGALDGAEVELYGYSISQAGPSVNFGFPVDSPDLVRDDDSETPLGPHGDHDDAAFTRDRLYGNPERVNATRSFGGNGPVRGTIEAGHSITVTTGWADAGSNDLGGFAEANAGSQGPTSVSAATSSMRIEKRITLDAGESGLAAGDLVTGLRWVFDGHGVLEVGGQSFPHQSGASAAAGIDLLLLRGPTGRCGAFDCPHGALAVAADLTTSLYVNSVEPAEPGDATAIARRHDTWSASNNTGVLKAGAVFDDGTTDVEVGRVTQEDVAVAYVDGVDTGADPLFLASIEFEANVGETLKLTMDLDLATSLAAWGRGESDFFGSFDGHVEDPLARGLVFTSSVAVPEPGAGGAGTAALASLTGAGATCARRRRRA